MIGDWYSFCVYWIFIGRRSLLGYYPFSTITDVIKVFGSNLFNFNFGSEMIDSIKKRIDLQYMRSKLMTEKIDGKPRIEENCD